MGDGELDLTPWEIDARMAATAHDISDAQAIDLVILDWLARGDAKAFADFVLTGHRPSHRVLQAVALMMLRGDPDCDFDPAKTGDPDLVSALPFALAVKSDKPGRKAAASKRARDDLIAREVARVMAGGSSYDGAVATVHDWLRKDITPDIGVETVRAAYDKRADRYGK